VADKSFRYSNKTFTAMVVATEVSYDTSFNQLFCGVFPAKRDQLRKSGKWWRSIFQTPQRFSRQDYYTASVQLLKSTTCTPFSRRPQFTTFQHNRVHTSFLSRACLPHGCRYARTILSISLRPDTDAPLRKNIIRDG